MPNVHVIFVNGCGRSGKDTFMFYFRKYAEWEHTACVITMDTVKPEKRLMDIVAVRYPSIQTSIARKTDAYRDTLAAMKDYLDEHYDLYRTDFNKQMDHIITRAYLLARIPGAIERDIVFFVVSREPEKIKQMKMDIECKYAKYYDKGLGVTTVLVKGYTSPEDYTNHADQNVMDMEYDIVVNNNGTILDLEYNTIKLAETFKWS